MHVCIIVELSIHYVSVKSTLIIHVCILGYIIDILYLYYVYIDCRIAVLYYSSVDIYSVGIICILYVYLLYLYYMYIICI